MLPVQATGQVKTDRTSSEMEEQKIDTASRSLYVVAQPASELNKDPQTGTERAAKKVFEVGKIAATATDIHPNKTHVVIAEELVKQQLPLEWRQVDEQNIANMALALEYIGINSFQEAVEMDLRIIPPGSILHTWTALYKTAIFDGKNNPEKHKDLNYVDRIKRSAAWLAEFDMPVLVVYSECEMPAAEITKMQQYFESDDNIVTLSVESDLKGVLTSTPGLSSFDTTQLMDGLRVAILRDFPEVLEVAKKHALNHHKLRAWTGFCQRTESICYSDIDNSWFTKPPYILSRQGLHSLPCFNTDCLLRVPECKGIIQKLSETDRLRLQKHQSYFTDDTFVRLRQEHQWTREAIDNSFRYIVSGKAHSEFGKLLTAIQKIAPDWFSFAHPDTPLWHGDNCMINLRKDALKRFREKADITKLSLDFFQDPKYHTDLTGDTYYLHSNTLVGVQLWRYLFRGSDASWQ